MAVRCHMLVGPPSSGKSTFARQLQAVIPAAVVISTDAIRAELFGDETIQGPWSEVEALVLRRIADCIATEQPVIYDATNVQRLWRMGLLQRLQAAGAEWIAWHLTTPLLTCLAWNEGRSPRTDVSTTAPQLRPRVLC